MAMFVLTTVSSRSVVFLVGLALLGLFFGGCSSDDDAGPRHVEHGAADSRRSGHTVRTETLSAACPIGDRPDYFVPGADRRPALLVGCARLGVSHKRAEFSLNLGRIDGEAHLCVNPAYTGRGRRGFYIPALCKLDPPPARFAVRDIHQPRQGVRGYALVVWGTAPAATAAVSARFGHATAVAAVFNVPAKLSRRFGEPPFSLFIVELPLRAACAPITVENPQSEATKRIARRPKLCEQLTLRPAHNHAGLARLRGHVHGQHAQAVQE